jgi:hypothetical protein
VQHVDGPTLITLGAPVQHVDGPTLITLGAPVQVQEWVIKSNQIIIINKIKYNDYYKTKLNIRGVFQVDGCGDPHVPRVYSGIIGQIGWGFKRKPSSSWCQNINEIFFLTFFCDTFETLFHVWEIFYPCGAEEGNFEISKYFSGL